MATEGFRRYEPHWQRLEIPPGAAVQTSYNEENQAIFIKICLFLSIREENWSPRLYERVLCWYFERIECAFRITLLGFYPRPHKGAALDLRRAVGPFETHFAIELATFFLLFPRVSLLCVLLYIFSIQKSATQSPDCVADFSYLLLMDANGQHTVLTIDIPILHNEAIIRFQTFHRLG